MTGLCLLEYDVPGIMVRVSRWSVYIHREIVGTGGEESCGEIRRM